MQRSRGNAGHRTGLATFYACGAVVGALVFCVALTGVLAEAREMWREGAAVFFSDAGMRLFAGACLGIVSAAPYALLARASRKTGPPMLFMVAAVTMLAVQVSLTLFILFFARSATATIGVFVIPAYFVVAAVALWMVVALARAVTLRRSSQ